MKSLFPVFFNFLQIKCNLDGHLSKQLCLLSTTSSGRRGFHYYKLRDGEHFAKWAKKASFFYLFESNKNSKNKSSAG